ncbi:MAG TPA: hypothetical protein VJP86_18155 [Vicinamibacterales bacterium]|nr:hypothetical protein [Vicinamibacterales bacterium]
MVKRIVSVIALVWAVGLGTAHAQTQSSRVNESVEASARSVIGMTTDRAATQPGTTSVSSHTEAVLFGAQNGTKATARVGVLEKWGDDLAKPERAFAFDMKLTNKLPTEGLPVLTSLDGLDDGAELSVGMGFIRYPKPEIANRAVFDEQAAIFRRVVPDQDEDTAYARFLRNAAPAVRSGWGYSAQGRVSFSNPEFKFRSAVDSTAVTEQHQQTSFKLSGSLVTPKAAAGDSGIAKAFSEWFATVDLSFGNDWDGTKAQSLCSPVSADVFRCESIAIGAPFDQDVRTVSITARRYIYNWVAVAPAWNKRWSDRVDGLPSPSDGKWSFDLPVYFLGASGNFNKGDLTGGVVISWARDQGQTYAVFVGALLKPFEF